MQTNLSNNESATELFATSEDLLNIEHIRKLCASGNYTTKFHFDVRIRDRGISLVNVIDCIMKGSAMLVPINFSQPT